VEQEYYLWLVEPVLVHVEKQQGELFPLSDLIEAAASVVAGGALNGLLAAQLDKATADGMIPALPAGIRAEWALTALLFAAPALDWVKGANGARLALASSGMAAAQVSDYFKSMS